MFLLYQAERQSRSVPAAGFVTFWVVWRQEFRTALRFQTKSQHAKCNACTSFKEFRKKADSPQTRAAWAEHYSQHLVGSYPDRLHY